MAKRPGCRRSHPRHIVEESLHARVEFGYPRPQDPPCRVRIRDVSEGGLGFVLEQELPGLEVGDCIAGVAIHIGSRIIRGDLLVMHFTPEATAGALCGALFYPADDGDLLAFRDVIRELEARTPDARVLAG